VSSICVVQRVSTVGTNVELKAAYQISSIEDTNRYFVQWRSVTVLMTGNLVMDLLGCSAAL